MDKLLLASSEALLPEILRSLEGVWSVLFFLVTAFVIYRVAIVVYWLMNSTFFTVIKLFKQIGINRKVRALVRSRDEQMKAALEKFAHVEVPEKLGDQIMRATVVQLKEMLHSNKVTSEQLVVFYARRAASVGYRLKALADVNFEAAWEEAKLCDKKLKETKDKNSLGLLFGIPISIKDNLLMKGFSSSAGLKSHSGFRAEADGLLVQCIRNEGGIPIFRSNVPQLLMLPECINPIWGVAQHPLDKKRAPGGSSGGEGVLVSTGCSPMGIGNDIGGSIRIPADACGLYGFKPTTGRITNSGFHMPLPHGKKNRLQRIIEVSQGPLAKSTEDCRLMMKVLCSPKMHSEDPIVAPQPWSEVPLPFKGPKPKFGFYCEMSIVPACDANRKGVEETVALLRKNGYECVELKIENEQELFDGVKAFSNDATGNDFLSGWHDDFVHFTYWPTAFTFTGPKLIVHLTRLFLKYVMRQFRSASLMRRGADLKDAVSINSLTDQQNRIRNNYFKLFEENQIDYFLMPTCPVPALKHNESFTGMSLFGYTAVWNWMGFPAGTVPVRKVLPGEDNYPTKFKGDWISNDARRSTKGSVGLPVGIQVVALPFEDEKVLSGMQLIEDLVKFKVGFYDEK